MTEEGGLLPDNEAPLTLFGEIGAQHACLGFVERTAADAPEYALSGDVGTDDIGRQLGQLAVLALDAGPFGLGLGFAVHGAELDHPPAAGTGLGRGGRRRGSGFGLRRSGRSEEHTS